jgi:hypothetical protein
MKPQIWTEEEVKILKENYGKIPYKEIQKLIPNHPFSAIQGKINSLGISNREIARLLKVKFPSVKKTVFFDENFFEVPNLLNCYWAGFIAADGNISKNNKKFSIQIGDKDFIHLIIICLKKAIFISFYFNDLFRPRNLGTTLLVFFTYSCTQLSSISDISNQT